jgi:hypothetical protein
MIEREYGGSAVGRDDLAEQIVAAGHEAVRTPWFEYLARWGYAAKGIVYLLAGGLSALAALGLRRGAADKVEALQEVFTGPLGQIALVLMAIGLAGYALLRFMQALLDLERKGSNLKGLALRAGFVGSALFYAGLAFAALRIAFRGQGAPDNQEQSLAALAFSLPFGRWIVGIAGLVVIGAGIWQGYLAYRARFVERFCWSDMSAAEQTWTTRVGRAGLVARGIIIALVGGFMAQAALLLDAGKVEGSDEALQSLAGLLGWWAVGAVAIGLALYGVYLLSAARYCYIEAARGVDP